MRKYFFLFVAFIVLLLPLTHVSGQEASTTIDITVTVKATKESAVEAKQTALAEGERRALFSALEQVAPNQGRDIYRKLRGGDLSRFVTAFTITREVQKAGNYEADIAYRFDKNALMSLTGEGAGLNATVEDAPTGDGLLIIPTYDADEQLLLFEPENFWRAIINNVALEVGQGKLVLPFGDKRDVEMLDDETILSGNRAVLSQIAKRYGTRNVVIAFARSREMDGVQRVDVVLRKAGDKKGEDIVLHYHSNSSVETLDLLLARAAKDVTLKLRASLEEYGLFGEAKDKKVQGLVIRVEYENGKQWREILPILQNITGLHYLDIGAVGVNFAQVTLYYRGDSALIERALLARNLHVDTSKKYWVIAL